MRCKLRRFLVGLLVVGSSASAAGPEPLVCSSDFWSGWGDPEISYSSDSLPGIDTAFTEPSSLPAEAKPEATRIYLTPGWAFAIGVNPHGQRRIWRKRRSLDTGHIDWTEWGGLPPGLESGPFLFTYGAVWLVGDRPGRPRLYRAPVHARSAVWNGAAPLPVAHVAGLQLLDDGTLAVKGLDRFGTTRWHVGEFLGGGKEISWAVDAAYSPILELSSIEMPPFTGPPSFSGDVDLGASVLMLALSWEARGDVGREPTIRYRTSPAEDAPYGPWSTTVSGSTLEIGRQGRYLQYQIQFPAVSEMSVGDIRVYYVFPEGGIAGRNTSASGGGHERDAPDAVRTASASPRSEDAANSSSEETDKQSAPQSTEAGRSDSPTRAGSASQPESRDQSSSSQANPATAPTPADPTQSPTHEGASNSPAAKDGTGEDAGSDAGQPSAAGSGGGGSSGGNGEDSTSPDGGSENTFDFQTDLPLEDCGETERETDTVLPYVPEPQGNTASLPNSGEPAAPSQTGSAAPSAEGQPGVSPSTTPGLSPPPTTPPSLGSGATSSPSPAGVGEGAEGGPDQPPAEPEGQLSEGGEGSNPSSQESDHLAPAEQSAPGAPDEGITPDGTQLASSAAASAMPAGNSLTGMSHSSQAAASRTPGPYQAGYVTMPWHLLASAAGLGWLMLLLLLLLLIRRRKGNSKDQILAPAAETCGPPTDRWLKRKLAMLLHPHIHFWPPDHQVASHLPSTKTSDHMAPTPPFDEMEETVAYAGGSTLPVDDNPAGMSAAAFQGKRALYFLDDGGQLYRSSIVGGRLRTARRVGAVPIHCDNPRLAATDAALFFLAPAADPGASRLFAAPVGPWGAVGRWRVLSLPRRMDAPTQFWTEGDRLLTIGAENGRSAMYAAEIEAGPDLRAWKRLIHFPMDTWPESVATFGDRCFIASRSARWVELLAVSVGQSRILSRLGRLDDVRGEAALVAGSDRVILLDGGDYPGTAQIRVANLDTDGSLSSWVSQSAGYQGVLRSLCGVVVDKSVLVAGRNRSGHYRHAPISSYAAALPRAS